MANFGGTHECVIRPMAGAVHASRDAETRLVRSGQGKLIRMGEERHWIEKRIEDLKAELPHLVRRMQAAHLNPDVRERYHSVNSQLDFLLEKLWDRPGSNNRMLPGTDQLDHRRRGGERGHPDGREAYPPNVLTVGTASQVPAGEVAWFFLNGVRVAVANVGGRLYAFRDSCTHCGCSLAEGGLRGPTVICPCDLRAFDVRTGEALGGPPLSALATYDVCVDGEEVRVSMNPREGP